MRPRVFPAEDLCPLCDEELPGNRFNEAAGIPRGRRRGTGEVHRTAGASMRPRVFPAEDQQR